MSSGYSIHEGLIGPQDLDSVVGSLSSAVSSRAGARHLLGHPAVRRLATSHTLLDLASRLLDRDAIPFRATLFDKSKLRNWLVVWHQDTALPLASRFESAEWGPWSTKSGIHYAHAPTWALEQVIALRVHIDDSTPENGPLRVIPGSHELGVLTDDDVRRVAGESRPIDCLVRRGGVMAMRPLLIHSSSKAAGDAPRRVLHIEYASSLNLGRGARLAMA